MKKTVYPVGSIDSVLNALSYNDTQFDLPAQVKMIAWEVTLRPLSAVSMIVCRLSKQFQLHLAARTFLTGPSSCGFKLLQPDVNIVDKGRQFPR